MVIELVAVIMPVYNCKDLIVRSAESVFSQTLDKERVKLIFIDNHSDDGSYEVILDLVSKNKEQCAVYRMQEKMRETELLITTYKLIASYPFFYATHLIPGTILYPSFLEKCTQGFINKKIHSVISEVDICVSGDKIEESKTVFNENRIFNCAKDTKEIINVDFGKRINVLYRFEYLFRLKRNNFFRFANYYSWYFQIMPLFGVNADCYYINESLSCVYDYSKYLGYYDLLKCYDPLLWSLKSLIHNNNRNLNVSRADFKMVFERFAAFAFESALIAEQHGDITEAEKLKKYAQMVSSEIDKNPVYLNGFSEKKGGKILKLDNVSTCIIMPVYNCKELIEESVPSILSQTLGLNNIKINFLDNSSNDGTYEFLLDLIASNKDIMSIYRMNKRRQDASMFWNASFMLALGAFRYSTILTPGSKLAPEFLERSISPMEEDLDLMFVLSETEKKPNTKPEVYYKTVFDSDRVFAKEDCAKLFLLEKMGYSVNTVYRGIPFSRKSDLSAIKLFTNYYDWFSKHETYSNFMYIKDTLSSVNETYMNDEIRYLMSSLLRILAIKRSIKFGYYSKYDYKDFEGALRNIQNYAKNMSQFHLSNKRLEMHEKYEKFCRMFQETDF